MVCRSCRCGEINIPRIQTRRLIRQIRTSPAAAPRGSEAWPASPQTWALRARPPGRVDGKVAIDLQRKPACTESKAKERRWQGCSPKRPGAQGRGLEHRRRLREAARGLGVPQRGGAWCRCEASGLRPGLSAAVHAAKDGQGRASTSEAQRARTGVGTAAARTRWGPFVRTRTSLHPVGTAESSCPVALLVLVGKRGPWQGRNACSLAGFLPTPGRPGRRDSKRLPRGAPPRVALVQPPDPHLTGRGALGLSISLAGGPGGGLGASSPALGVVTQMEKLASGPGINKAGKEVARWKLHEVGTGISKGPAERRTVSASAFPRAPGTC